MMDIYSEPFQVADALVGIANPEIQILEDQDTYGRYSVEPLERGLGTTIGNSVRRVLLSSIEGAAITWVKIQGIQHEYSTIGHVTEDVTEFLLNVKGIRLKANSDQPGRLFLEAQGEGEVLAGNISPAAEYEVVNPDLHLATMDSADAELSVEFNVERGRGYVAASNVNGLPIGALPVDAVFTPVRKVNFKVEPIRTGPYIGKERVVLDAWTDGAIRPTQALKEAGQALINYFSLLANLTKPITGPDGRSLNIPAEHYEMSLENLSLPSRIFNCLSREGLESVGDVLALGEENLLKIRNFGDKSLSELYSVLLEHGIDMQAILSGANEPEEEPAEEGPTDEELAQIAVAELLEDTPTDEAEEAESEPTPEEESEQS